MTIGELVNDPAAHHYAIEGWSCDVCKAPKRIPCMNPLHPGQPLPGRRIHFARLVDRRREPKEDD